jgi:hypothetical protein
MRRQKLENVCEKSFCEDAKEKSVTSIEDE